MCHKNRRKVNESMILNDRRDIKNENPRELNCRLLSSASRENLNDGAEVSIVGSAQINRDRMTKGPKPVVAAIDVPNVINADLKVPNCALSKLYFFCMYCSNKVIVCKNINNFLL